MWRIWMGNGTDMEEKQRMIMEKPLDGWVEMVRRARSVARVF